VPCTSRSGTRGAWSTCGCDGTADSIENDAREIKETPAMTTIPPVTPISTGSTLTGASSAPGASATAPAASSSNPLNQLDNTQTFLQLLVAQLENQDPTNPTDPTTFMTEISQLTAVESQTNLASEEQVVAADSMIGLDVTGSGAAGTVSGQVTGVLLSPSGAPELEVGTAKTPLALTSVTSVTQPVSSGGASASGTASAPASGTTSTPGSASTTSTPPAGSTGGSSSASS
jgi:flagellar basal-body rod modification protein FlgD